MNWRPPGQPSGWAFLRLASVLLLGCRLPPGTIPQSPDATPTELTRAQWGCDQDQTEWALTAQTSGLTDGAELWLADDRGHVEAHPVPSIRRAGDGSTDEVGVRLGVEVDLDRVRLGRSTRFTCQAPPSALLVVFEAPSTPVECVIFGPDIDWVTVTDAPDCPSFFEP